MRRLLSSLAEARPVLRSIWSSGASIGSVHTLGSLHEGHEKMIEIAASENEHVIVTIYPNKAQFAPGTHYSWNLERDSELAFDAGATVVISSTDEEMYPPLYATFLDQGARTQRLDGTVVPFLFRGMISMCIRWISFVRPTRTYWGKKDIGQLILVQRAIDDLLIDTEVRPVDCIRFRSGVPISSRLLTLDRESLAEVASVYHALVAGRELIAAGETECAAVRDRIREALRLERFEACSVKVADAVEFEEPAHVPERPFILQVITTNGTINHFDSELVRTRAELEQGSKVLWLGREWPDPDARP